MAKQIIVLEKNGTKQVVAFWLSVPEDRRQAFAKSPDGFSVTPKSPDEALMFESGELVEQIEEMEFKPEMTIDEIHTAMINEFTRLQSALVDKTFYVKPGSYYDGKSWVTG